MCRCIRCNCNTKKKGSRFNGRRVLKGPDYVWQRQYLQESGIDATESSIICSKCRTQLYRLKKSEALLEKENVQPSGSGSIEEQMPSTSNTTNTHALFESHNNTSITFSETELIPSDIFEETDCQSISINAKMLPRSNSRCVLCKASVVHGRCTTIPTEARLDLLIRFRLLSHAKNRICLSHLADRRLSPSVTLDEDAMQEQRPDLTGEEAAELIEEFISFSAENQSAFTLDYFSPNFSDFDCQTWTGWTKQQFEEMVPYLCDSMKCNSNRDLHGALLTFWVKLKTNLSFQQIGSISDDQEFRPRECSEICFKSISCSYRGTERELCTSTFGTFSYYTRTSP